MDFSIIFDMDGVLVNTIPYHRQAWRLFCKKYNFDFEGKLNNILPGKTTAFLLNHLFKRELPEEERKKYALEKAGFYKNLCYENMLLINGVIPFLDKVKEKNIPVAIGTAGSPHNVSFIMENTLLKNYFSVIVDASHVSRSKPDPEVFLKAAAKINADPKKCVVFEDAIAGIQAAKNAGMKVIALATTYPREELSEADLIINDFSEIDLEKISSLFE